MQTASSSCPSLISWAAIPSILLLKEEARSHCGHALPLSVPIHSFSLSQVQFSGPASHVHLFCPSCPHAGKSDLLAPDWWTQTQQEPLMGSCTRSRISQKLLPLGRCFKSNTNKQLFLLEGSHSILPTMTRRDVVLEWLRRYKYKMLRTSLAEKW